MLTPHLEKLILCGKASFNTYVIGGAHKNIFNVRKDHFIIITDLVYFNQINSPNLLNDLTLAQLNALQLRNNTQLKVFSAKTQNNFIFRNNFTLTERGNSNTFHVTPVGSTKLDTYLVHESDISFTFSVASNLVAASTIGYLAPNDSEIGFPPPFDLGIKGQRGAIANNNITKSALTEDLEIYSSAGGQLYNENGLPTTNELTFPVDTISLLPGLESAMCYPLLNVSYVEISGNLTNIQS